jgi:hypothetical protein
VFKLRSSSLIGAAVLAPLLVGCARHPPLPPVVGAEGETAARAAFEKFTEAVDRGDQDKVWAGLSARSQYRLQGGGEGEKKTGDRTKVLETVRKAVGRNPKVKDARGTRAGVNIEIETAPGRTREFEMVLEDGAWKLNLFSS